MRAIAAMAAAFSLAACASAPDEARSRDLAADGRVIVEQRCVSCHAIGESGESPRQDAPPLRRLAERYPVTALEEAFAEGILVGHPAMPALRFTPEEIAAITAYLESIQERRGG
jgi:mono/diheme cytochrome c family protein